MAGFSVSPSVPSKSKSTPTPALAPRRFRSTERLLAEREREASRHRGGSVKRLLSATSPSIDFRNSSAVMLAVRSRVRASGVRLRCAANHSATFARRPCQRFTTPPPKTRLVWSPPPESLRTAAWAPRSKASQMPASSRGLSPPSVYRRMSSGNSSRSMSCLATAQIQHVRPGLLCCSGPAATASSRSKAKSSYDPWGGPTVLGSAATSVKNARVVCVPFTVRIFFRCRSSAPDMVLGWWMVAPPNGSTPRYLPSGGGGITRSPG
mmetsp:Transcript_141612/g.440253  ORF Transcript_141612/g.440253 Transcript_141612/m.440253 type:complete len:265 (+) Transcript_141612:1159-1953(+)